MYFEPVTYAPIDLDGVDPQYMTEKERQALNDYHAMVYGKLFPLSNRWGTGVVKRIHPRHLKQHESKKGANRRLFEICFDQSGKDVRQMVRDYRPSDLDRILKIWLQANIQAHDFIDRSYWEEK